MYLGMHLYSRIKNRSGDKGQTYVSLPIRHTHTSACLVTLKNSYDLAYSIGFRHLVLKSYTQDQHARNLQKWKDYRAITSNHQSESDAMTAEPTSSKSSAESVNSYSVLGGVSILATACCSKPTVMGAGTCACAAEEATLPVLAVVLVELLRRCIGRRTIARRV